MDFVDAHARMVKDLYLSIEQRSNKNHSDSPEYDIQQIIADFYEGGLKNTIYSVKREREGKFDIVIYKEKKHLYITKLRLTLKVMKKYE